VSINVSERALPRVEREIRQVIEGIEEEERDEGARRTRWRSRAAV
jgi:hypothetical protein